MGAVLAGGPGAVLSHRSAAELWRIHAPANSVVEISVPANRRCRRAGLVAHRRERLEEDEITTHDGIRVTSPTQTLIDVAGQLGPAELETAINAADKLDLADPEELRRAANARTDGPGAAVLRDLLDRRTFQVTDSRLERMFLPIARQAGLPSPLTQQHVNGFRVDFHWPDLGLVVETDGLRYHRTPQQQSADRRRDQAHVAAGLTVLRFSHAQVRFEPAHVLETLTTVARRLTDR
jgi:very-short-patch-repair endonuclease